MHDCCNFYLSFEESKRWLQFSSKELSVPKEFLEEMSLKKRIVWVPNHHQYPFLPPHLTPPTQPLLKGALRQRAWVQINTFCLHEIVYFLLPNIGLNKSAEASSIVRGETYISDVIGMSSWTFCKKRSIFPVSIITKYASANGDYTGTDILSYLRYQLPVSLIPVIASWRLSSGIVGK